MICVSVYLGIADSRVHAAYKRLVMKIAIYDRDIWYMIDSVIITL